MTGADDPYRSDPSAPVDYPADAGLPPPVVPPPYPGGPYHYGTPGYAYDPYRPLRPVGTNGKAIAALVLSLLGLTCCAVTAVPGVVLGVTAMRETKRTGQDGWGIALAGTIIGGLFIAGFAVYLLLYIGLIAGGWQWA